MKWHGEQMKWIWNSGNSASLTGEYMAVSFSFVCSGYLNDHFLYICGNGVEIPNGDEDRETIKPFWGNVGLSFMLATEWLLLWLFQVTESCLVGLVDRLTERPSTLHCSPPVESPTRMTLLHLSAALGFNRLLSTLIKWRSVLQYDGAT